jgi:hypothetical protein
MIGPRRSRFVPTSVGRSHDFRIAAGYTACGRRFGPSRSQPLMSRMITEDDLKDFPADRSLAFLRFERLRGRLEEAQQIAHENEGTDRYEFDYMSSVLAAAGEYEIQELMGYEMPLVQDGDARAKCRQFRLRAEHVAMRLLIRHSHHTNEYSVAFDAATKERLRHHLGQIRIAVDKLEVSDAKRDRLYTRIEALQLEIDRDRTRIESLAALIAEAADGAEPVLRVAEKIAGIFGKAKQIADEQARLPAPKQPKRIEGPKKQIAAPRKPKQTFKQLDDEIPF